MKDAKGHGSNPRGGGGTNEFDGKPLVPGYTSRGAQLLQATMRKSGGEPIVGVPAHSDGVEQVGKSPLTGMTQAKWDSMSPAQRDAMRDNGLLNPQLKGLEGHRVEAVRNSGETTRFIVGKSTGWTPVHLEIKRQNSSGGFQADSSYKSVRSLGKVR